MSYYDDISSVFPGVDWHGGSKIHVSVAAGGSLKIPFENRALILYLLQEKQLGWAIWRNLQAKFGKMEWLLDGDTFSKLFLVDVDRNLQGLPTSDSPDRIKNPATGNLFHRIALLPPYIGGVRFWAVEIGGETCIGYRFRIVKQLTDEEEANVREEARVRAAQVEVDINSVYETILEIAEPPPLTEANKIVKLVEQMEM